LVIAAAPAIAADFDIAGPSAGSETLNADETGRVRAGGTLTGVLGSPAVDIVGSGAHLDNDGTIIGLNLGGRGITVRGPITNVTLDNSGVMVDNMGTIAPGNSVGTIKVTGDVTFAPGSVLEIEADATGIDRLEVMGDVRIDPAAALDLTIAPGLPDLQGATIAEATGTIDAPFQRVNSAGVAGLVVVELVDGNKLALSVLTPSLVNVAAQGVVESGFAFQRAVVDEQRAPRTAPDSRLWARGFADFVERDGGGANPASRQDITGVAFGGDTPVLSDGLRLGLAGGYLTNDAEATDGSGASAEVDSLQGLAYGTYDFDLLGDGTQLFFGLQGGHQDQDTRRTLFAGDAPTTARGDTSGYLLGGYFGVGREIPIDANWAVRPAGQLSYLHQVQDGYRDSEGLAVDDLTLDTLRLGPRVELLGHYVDADGVVFRPRGTLGWTEQLSFDDRRVRVTLPTGAGGDLALEDGDEGYLTVGFGLDVIFRPGLRAYVGFDGAYGAAQTRSGAFAGISIDLP
jgi:outer membrane autotransporter protein